MNTNVAIVAKPGDSLESLRAELAKVKSERDVLLQAKKKRTRLAISEKGGLSVYGLGRFPVTLYKSQWLALLELVDQIREFIKAHDSELKTKE